MVPVQHNIDFATLRHAEAELSRALEPLRRVEAELRRVDFASLRCKLESIARTLVESIARYLSNLPTRAELALQRARTPGEQQRVRAGLRNLRARMRLQLRLAGERLYFARLIQGIVDELTRILTQLADALIALVLHLLEHERPVLPEPDRAPPRPPPLIITPTIQTNAPNGF